MRLLRWLWHCTPWAKLRARCALLEVQLHRMEGAVSEQRAILENAQRNFKLCEFEYQGKRAVEAERDRLLAILEKHLVVPSKTHIGKP